MQCLLQWSCQTLEAFPFFSWCLGKWKLQCVPPPHSLLVCSCVGWLIALSQYNCKIILNGPNIPHSMSATILPTYHDYIILSRRRETTRLQWDLSVMTAVSCLMSCGECHQVCHHGLTHNANVILPLVYSNYLHNNASEGWLWEMGCYVWWPCPAIFLSHLGKLKVILKVLKSTSSVDYGMQQYLLYPST